MPRIPDSKFQIPQNRKPLIFLIGMPGAGKTFWGRKLSVRHGWQFVDLDDVITERENASISDLFARFGEEGFRKKEHRHLLGIIKELSHPAIVACGGGTPCFHHNINLMKDAGVVIYLQADIPTLMLHLETETDIRPLLKGKADLPGYLQSLLQQRQSTYEQATIILSSEGISFTTFDEIIHTCTDRR